MKKRTYFNSIHPTNTFNLEGYLPDDKERMLQLAPLRSRDLLSIQSARYNKTIIAKFVTQ